MFVGDRRECESTLSTTRSLRTGLMHSLHGYIVSYTYGTESATKHMSALCEFVYQCVSQISFMQNTNETNGISRELFRSRIRWQVK